MSAPAKKPEDGIDKAAGCLLLLALWPAIVVWGSFCELHLWQWFVLPSFPSAPHLTMPMFAGLSAFIAAFRGYRSDPTTANQTMLESAGTSFGRAIVYPGMILLTGWIIKAVWL